MEVQDSGDKKMVLAEYIYFQHLHEYIFPHPIIYCITQFKLQLNASVRPRTGLHNKGEITVIERVTFK